MKRTAIYTAVLLALAACGNKESEYDATGTFETTEVTVSAKATGELKAFHVVEGQELEEGEVMGNIDITQLQLKKDELSASDSQLEANSSQLAANQRANSSHQLDLGKQAAVIRQQIANLERERQRYSELVADGAVARQKLDEVNYQISVLQKQLAATEDQISSTNRGLEEQNEGLSQQRRGLDAQRKGNAVRQAELDDQIANALVKSPISGTVLEKYVEQGEYVTVGKPMFKVADMKNMVLRAYVTSEQLSGIKLGQKVTVMSDYGGGKGKSYEGQVVWISSRSEFTPKNIQTSDERADMVYAVKISVKNDGLLKMGMYGKVKF